MSIERYFSSWDFTPPSPTPITIFFHIPQVMFYSEHFQE